MTSHRFLFDIECTFKWKFTTFSVHPSLILQKHILTHLNFVRHLMASIIITALFVLFRANVCTNYLMYVCFYGDRSCRNGIRSFFVEKSVNFYSLSIPTKPYSTSIGKVSSRLYRKYGENSVEVYLLALCANETISIYWANHGDSHQELSLMGLWRSYSVVRKAHLTENDTRKLWAAQYWSCCVKLW